MAATSSPLCAGAAHTAELRSTTLRPACAGLPTAARAHPEAIQERLGHSSIQVTMDRCRHLLASADAGLR